MSGQNQSRVNGLDMEDMARNFVMAGITINIVMINFPGLIGVYAVMLLPSPFLFLMYGPQIVLILLVGGLFIGVILPYLVMQSITPKDKKINSATFIICGAVTLFFIGGFSILIAGILILKWVSKEKPVNLPTSSAPSAPTSTPPNSSNLTKGTNMGRADKARVLALAGIVLNISALILLFISVVARLADPLQGPFSLGLGGSFMVTFVFTLCLGMILPVTGYHSITARDRVRAGAVLIVSGMLTIIPLFTMIGGVFLVIAGVFAFNWNPVG